MEPDWGADLSQVDPVVPTHLGMLLPDREPADRYFREGMGVGNQYLNCLLPMSNFEDGSHSGQAFHLAYSHPV